jgi:alginate O-acetyltransferase complex protein AlgI
MLFTSAPYLALLASVLLVYYTLSRKGQTLLLMTASFFFYGWLGIDYALALGGSTIANYFAGRAIARAGTASGRKTALWLGIGLNLGMLGYYKYTNFALDAVRPLVNALGWEMPVFQIALPAGISFYTFQAMAYLIDVYRGKTPPAESFLRFAAFHSFFPQLIAGPIERAQNLMTQIGVRHAFRFEQAGDGLVLLFLGLAKKLVLADRLSYYVGDAFLHPENYDSGKLFVAMLLMPISLYLDFSAYTDLARGSGKLLGIELSRNFDFPYATYDPAEFWRRWHMTLSSWIRDYLFEPLGGIDRHSAFRTFVNVMIAITVMGLWHGASWNFVLWGAGNGLILALYLIWKVFVSRRSRRKKEAWLSCALQFLVFRGSSFLLIVLFFTPDLSTAFAFWRGMGDGLGAALLQPARLGMLLFVAGFFLVQFGGAYLPWRAAWERMPAPVKGCACALLFYLVLFGADNFEKKFVYFEF